MPMRNAWTSRSVLAIATAALLLPAVPTASAHAEMSEIRIELTPTGLHVTSLSSLVCVATGPNHDVIVYCRSDEVSASWECGDHKVTLDAAGIGGSAEAGAWCTGGGGSVGCTVALAPLGASCSNNDPMMTQVWIPQVACQLRTTGTVTSATAVCRTHLTHV
jgi:hypothetical protein